MLNITSKVYINKLYALNSAKACGLSIPRSMVTTSKRRLQQFLNEEGQVIVKSLETPFFYADKDGWVMQYTYKLEAAFLEASSTEVVPPEIKVYIQRVCKEIQWNVMTFRKSTKLSLLEWWAHVDPGSFFFPLQLQKSAICLCKVPNHILKNPCLKHL